jgi:hypothetical protein
MVFFLGMMFVFRETEFAPPFGVQGWNFIYCMSYLWQTVLLPLVSTLKYYSSNRSARGLQLNVQPIPTLINYILQKIAAVGNLLTSSLWILLFTLVIVVSV